MSVSSALLAVPVPVGGDELRIDLVDQAGAENDLDLAGVAEAPLTPSSLSMAALFTCCRPPAPAAAGWRSGRR